MSIDQFKQHGIDLAKSFIGAVGAAMLIAALNWIGAHIPAALQAAGMLASAYGTQKIS